MKINANPNLVKMKSIATDDPDQVDTQEVLQEEQKEFK